MNALGQFVLVWFGDQFCIKNKTDKNEQVSRFVLKKLHEMVSLQLLCHTCCDV